ncbi:MAG: hypothetical protein ACI8RZ_000507 [Myxococcota bacterium]|jgi:hypothetical protein
MTLRILLPFGLLLALACGGGDDPTPTPTPEVTPEPAADDAPVIVSEPLDGYAYLPGPDGKPESARFSRFSNSNTVFVGVDDANLRDADGSIIARLPLGTQLSIVEVVSEPTVAIDRLNVWYTVTTTGVSQEGRLFGGLLTPYGGREYLGEDGGERGWAVTFAPDGRPRLRIDKTPGSDEAVTLDLSPSDRFVGGSLKATAGVWGDFGTRFEVMQCRLDGGASPECSTATARIGDDGQSLEPLTPPDPWQYAAPWVEPVCSGGTTLPVSLLPARPSEPVLTAQIPEYHRGPDGSVPCFDVATVRSGAHQGKTVVSCVQQGTDKSGTPYSLSERYLRDADGWTHLPCASDMKEGASIQATLVKARTRVSIDASINTIEGLGVGPETLSFGDQTATFSHVGEVNLATLVPAFLDATAGQIYVNTDKDYSNSGALVIPYPDSSARLYRWAPTLTWAGTSPLKGTYATQTIGCDGQPIATIDIEPEVKPGDLEIIGTLTDGLPVGRLKSTAHPVNTRMLAWYRELGEYGENHLPEGFTAGQSDAEVLTGDHWLFIGLPWGQQVRMTRTNLKVPAWCEPILYVYADPPAEVTIAPRPPLSFFHTIPHGPDGWQGIAQPDGSVVVDGRRWPELFWEGRSGWFDRPGEGVVVAEADIEAYLTAALVAQGLQGREVDGFLEAWLPDLLGQGAVWIGFHPPEAINALGPLDITPAPDTLIRVLMDATPTDAAPDWDGTLPPFAPVPERAGMVVVEWGGMTRE